MNHTLYLGNVSETSSEASLTKEFSAFGTVAGVNMVKDRVTAAPKGYAFVEMSSAEEAQKAIEGLNGKSIDGNEIVVSEAKPNAAASKTAKKAKRGKGGAKQGPLAHPGPGDRDNRW